MTQKHTPTPWKVSENAYGCFFIQHGEGRAMSLIAGGNNHDTLEGGDAAHIVKCVNMHDELVGSFAELFKWLLKGDEEESDEEIDSASEMLERCRATLKKAGAL